ncbi:MAG TPA: hypothetical protein VGH33_22030, partial [Isosphaeraceae bacterium]
MSVDPAALNPILTPAVVVERRPRRWRWLIAATLVVVAGGWAWASGAMQSLFADEGPRLALVQVDSGPLEIYLVETGSLESARNTSIKCQVEALLGTTGGAAGAGRTGSISSSTQSGGAGGTGGGSGYGQSGGSSGSTSSKAGAKGAAAKAGSASGSATPTSAGTATVASASSAATTSDASSSDTGSVQRPTIRSFNYNVAKYVPLKTATPAKTTTTTTAIASGGMGGGMG